MSKEKPDVEKTEGMRNNSAWVSAGFKKFDDAMVKTKHGQERVAVRFNKDSGQFGACVADMTFECKDYKGLVEAMGEHLNALESLEYTRYILVEYSQRHSSRRGPRGSKHWGGGGDEDRPVSGIYLEFDVYDVSNPFELAVYGHGPRGKSRARVWRRMEREESTGEWQPAGGDETRHIYDEDDINHLIEYTEPRYQTLNELFNSLGKIAEVLDGMFGEKMLTSGKSAKLLDAMMGQKLLAAPAEEKPKKKGRRR